MTYTEAKKYLARAERNGYVAYHSGLVNNGETGRRATYGINIDGDGREGRYFGSPQIIWSAEQAERKFPARQYKSQSPFGFGAHSGKTKTRRSENERKNYDGA
jgi:hypothetical protein